MKLTPKQEAFAQAYVKTGNASAAYREAYDTQAKPESVHVNAQKLLSNTKVALRVKELQDIAKQAGEAEFEISVSERKRLLHAVMTAGLTQDDNGKFANLGAVTGAISEYNKMTGDHAAIKTENRHSISREEMLELLK